MRTPGMASSKVAVWSATALLLVVLAACSNAEPAAGDSTGAPTSSLAVSPTTETPQVAGGTAFGVAGLIPPHFPDSTSEDWETMFGTFSETGSHVGVFQNWYGDPATKGEILTPVRVIFELAKTQPLIPVIGIGMKAPAPGGGVISTIDYSSSVEREQFVTMLVKTVEEFDVAYLLIGAEINRLWLSDPEAFDEFVNAYSEAYDAVKAVSPETVVFTGFQLEMMRGDAYLMGTSEERDPQWDLVDQFEGRLDLLSFTTYPGLDFTDPSDMPDDYYSSIQERFPIPLAFTEIGWPSDPITVPGAEEYGGTEAEQVAFVERFGDLMAGLDVELLLWSFPYDVGEVEPAPFQTVSLRRSDGTPKLGLAAWQKLAGVQSP